MRIHEDITIVLISFKSRDKIKKFIKNVSKKFRIIIIENSYDYELKDEIKSADNVSIFLKDNIGYGRAANFAKSKVSTKYFLLCNPDLENINDNAIEIFYNIAENLYPNFLSLGPSYKDNEINKKFNHIKKNKISGACMFLNSLSFKKLGGFDENIFLYFEEDDLCKRGNKLKLFSYQLNNLIVHHEVGTSASNINEIEKRKIKELTLWHFIWSKFYFSKKKYGKFISLLIFLPIIIRIITKIFLNKLIKNKKQLIKYKTRYDGLINSIKGNKSSLRP